jgi:hypothetical protein
VKHISLNLEEDELEALDTYADKEGLSRNGAVTHLLAAALGGVAVPAVRTGNLRQAFAQALLKQAQLYTGVQPVVIEGDKLVKVEDPATDDTQFYANKGAVEYTKPVPQKLKKRSEYDQTPDEEDY